MEDCMSILARMTPEQRTRLGHLVLLSLRQEPGAWRLLGTITWIHDGLNIAVSCVMGEITITDGSTGSYLVRRERSLGLMRVIRGKTEIDQIWDILHRWRHAEVETIGENILKRFEQHRTTPEVSRLKELVDATRG